MREIKFRAVCKETDQILDQAYNGQCLQWLHEGQADIIIQQYTGLKDKNGVEVYEGDVVEHYQNTFDVYYDESDAAFALGCGGYQEMRLCDVSNSLIKVIGNIYENPELLKE